ncbi:hypothetical protein CLOM_g22787 [Closterium sp. NIES-68]|nr:hypothetical protein CLOM_g22787 [Closterium sp. NIES-68]GJP76522.1 hypothetical protein CLOP_g6954 [Closterium sp. NIES-67]
MTSAVTSEDVAPSRDRKPAADSSGGQLPRRRLDVAVIGAGAAGLAAARELMREGHTVTVIEAGGEIGGVWAYDERIETEDLLGLDANRQQVHSSMYASLRTNLPRELMGFLDFPFSAPLPGDRPGADVDLCNCGDADLRRTDADMRRFPSHREVLRYLGQYADRFGISNRVELHSSVIKAVPVIARQADVKESRERRSGEARSAREAEKGQGKGEREEEGEGKGEGEGQDIQELLKGGDSSFVRWRVKIARSREDSRGSCEAEVEEGRVEEREFDALVVCNGHYSQPKIATVEGVDTWPGIHMHSHNYRYPEGFEGKVVVVVGAEASGQDIARELASVAQEVHICARGWRKDSAAASDDAARAAAASAGTGATIAAAGAPTAGAAAGAIETGYFEDLKGRVQQHPMIRRANADGTVEFEDGFTCHADVIMHCTGYIYSFPFLALPPSLLSVCNNRVGPLFRHILPPALAPSLSFIGLPWKVVPFPLCQLQARWVAQLLSGRLSLPPRSDLEDGVRCLYASMEEQGVPERYTHRLDMEQFPYMDNLSMGCGGSPLPAWRREMYEAVRRLKKAYPGTYRDEWVEWDLVEAAHREFARLFQDLASPIVDTEVGVMS